mgnify:CR=1 FL=1
MPNYLEELKQGLKLLKLEWQEDLAQYKKKFLNTSVADKKKEGITWHPILLKKTKIGMGERLIIEVERTDTSYPSAFGSGKSVSFYSTQEGYHGAEFRVNGVVNQAKKDTLIVTLQADEVPDWMDSGRLGVDLLFDEASYREMESVMKKVITSDNPRLTELRDIAYGEKSPKFKEVSKLEMEGLNFSQNLACQKIESAQDFAIVHGPPGTGKTTTLIAAIQRAVEQNQRILRPQMAQGDRVCPRCKTAAISPIF